jgi:uncharacterized membrane protein YgcG
MRKQAIVGLILIGALAAGPAARVLADAREDAKADAVMAEARKALGGEKKLADLKALSMRAEFRRESSGPVQAGGGSTFVMIGGGGSFSGGGGGQTTGSLAIDMVFPDKLYREETTTGGFSITRVDGFEGDRPFLDLTSNTAGARVAADNPAADPARAKDALKRSHTDLARLMLGLVAGTQPGLPVTYTYAGQAESPDGTAHMIDVKGVEDFKARLFIDTATHLPLMLTYMEAEPRPIRMMQHGAPGSGGTRVVTPGGAAVAGGSSASGSGGASASGSGGASVSASPMANLTPEQRAEIDKHMKEAAATPPKMIEYRMFFADYREVSGISLPHRITRGTGEKTTEEWEIKDYKVNPNIKADRFKVGTN